MHCNFFLELSSPSPAFFGGGELTKSGIPGWFLNKIGYLFFATGRAYARPQNASKTRSGAGTYYALCARSAPNRFFGVRPLKTAPMTAPKKCSSRTTRFCSYCTRFCSYRTRFCSCRTRFCSILQNPRRPGNGHLPSTQHGRSFTQLGSCRM